MPPIARRPLTPPPAQTVDFGSLSAYAGGFTLPEGDYAMEFTAKMHANTKQDGTPAGPERLGIMIAAYPLAGGEPMNQFMSMGTKASQTFAPGDDGKSIVLVPGGPGGTFNNKTNWAIFLKSLYDCGLPEGIFTNDLTVLDGVHVHTQLIPEPTDRKGFGAATGEAEQEERKGPGMTVVVTEIKEDGKPWEGTGGIPDGTAPKAPAKVAGKIAPKVAPKVAVKAAPVAVAQSDDEAILSSAVSAITTVLERNPAGCTRLLLRTKTFSAVGEADGAEMAQAVMDSIFSDDATLSSVLEQLDYQIVGNSIKPKA